MNNLEEQFYQVMTNLRLRGSRSASTTTQVPKDDARVTEIINGVIVSKPAKKVEYIGATKDKNESEPEIIDLQEYAKV